MPENDKTPRRERSGDPAALAAARRDMVRCQIAARGLTQARLLEVLERVPRHSFVPPEAQLEAYGDHPLPIGAGQTISQPYVVALMTSVLELCPEDNVLEVGSGSGYQTAILAELVRSVHAIEIRPELQERAERVLAELGYENVRTRVGDGRLGWPEAAPFDAILVAAAPARVPEPLLDQLAVGGRLVLPVGDALQALFLIRRTLHGFEERRILSVRFVPMIGGERPGDG